MHRFFVAPELVRSDTGVFVLPEKLAHQVHNVLHIGVGERLILLDNSGEEYTCVVTKSGRGTVEVTLEERRRGRSEPAVRVILCQGLLKSARFEWILEKGTELGITTFSPILCRRSMSGLEDAGAAKLQRWQRILQEATEQCGGARVPELLPIRPLMHALNDIPAGAMAIMPWEEEQTVTLRAALQDYKQQAVQSAEPQPLTVVLFIGPEGGLTPEEAQLARRRGVQVVTLGTRILRAETAAITTIASTIYELTT